MVGNHHVHPFINGWPWGSRLITGDFGPTTSTIFSLTFRVFEASFGHPELYEKSNEKKGPWLLGMTSYPVVSGLVG